MNLIQPLTPIIDLTDNCNLACVYCYAGSQRINYNTHELNKINNVFKNKMPLLTAFIDNVVSYNKNNGIEKTELIMHGGEPLLIDHDNWAILLDYIFNKKLYPIEMHVQTNGTLISDNFVKLFKEHEVKVGLSIDGPPKLHDKTRKFKSGNGTFEKINENIQFIRENELDFGCLVTINKYNLNPEEIYNFFKETNISFDVRPICETGYLLEKNYLINPYEYSKFVCDLFNLWFDDQETPPNINDFENIILRFIKPLDNLTNCTHIMDCSKRFIAFNMAGDVWPCNCLPSKEFLYTNINNKNIDIGSILESTTCLGLSGRWTHLSKNDCKNCNISNYCYGGCPSRAYAYNQDYFQKDPFCLAYKKIINHIYERLKGSIKND